MKTCLIMSGGSINLKFAADFLGNRTYDFIVAADAGAEVLKKLSLTPDEIVGDLDTVNPAVIKEYAQKSVRMEIHNAEKDETDTELALMTAVREGCHRADMLGALGGRMDHALSNIQLLYQYYLRGLDVHIVDERNDLYILNSGRTFYRDKLYGKYISFLPLTETVEGLTLKGFKYPLQNKELHLGTSLCISNELAEETGTLEVKKGALICVESHD